MPKHSIVKASKSQIRKASTANIVVANQDLGQPSSEPVLNPLQVRFFVAFARNMVRMSSSDQSFLAALDAARETGVTKQELGRLLRAITEEKPGGYWPPGFM